MNFTESFEQFSSKLSTMDLALYAGIGLVLWVMFKEKLSPVQAFLLNLFNQVKSKVNRVDTNVPVVVSPVVTDKPSAVTASEDLFFNLVVSWKQTRDLAVRSGCAEAVKVADQMFPFLSPTVCNDTKDVV